jgi:hypothetical protein
MQIQKEVVYMLLERINGVNDIKQVDAKQYDALAEEIRTWLQQEFFPKILKRLLSGVSGMAMAG